MDELTGPGQASEDSTTLEAGLDEIEAFRLVGETIDDVLWVVDWVNHRVLYVSSAYEDVWGRTAASLYADPLAWVAGIHPDDREGVEAAFLGMETTGGYDEEFRVVRPNGTVRWVRDRGRLVRDGDGNAVRVAGVAQDITEQRAARLFREGQTEVFRLVADGHDLGLVLAAAIGLIEAQTDGMRGSVLLLSEDGKHLVTGAAPSLPDAYTAAIDGVRIGPAVGSCGTAAHQKKRVVVSDIRTDPLWADYRELAAAHGLRACWSEPILGSTGRVLGTFAIYYDRVRLPDEAELRLIEHAAGLCRVAIESKRSEESLRQLIEAAPDGMLIVDQAGRIVRINRQTELLFGYSRDELLGEPVELLVPPELVERHRALRERAFSSSLVARAVAPDRIIHGLRRDGSRVPLGVSLSKLLTNEGPVVVAAARDVTHRVEAMEAMRRHSVELEDRVLSRTRELLAAKEKSESADRMKSAFLAAMSHELRTPLNSVIGFTGILLAELTGPLNDEQKKQLSLVKGSARHLLDLINDVLDLSKIEAGQLELHNRPFELPEVIQTVVASMAPTAAAKRLTLDLELGAVPTPVMGDRRRTQQVVLNLVGNAIKFTDEGRVLIACRASDGRVVIRVTDTGIGIKPEQMGILFRPFEQVDTGLARRAEGTGLGLAICARLAEKMGGNIDVESTWGQGSTFSFTFPVVCEREPDIR